MRTETIHPVTLEHVLMEQRMGNRARHNLSVSVRTFAKT